MKSIQNCLMTLLLNELSQHTGEAQNIVLDSYTKAFNVQVNEIDYHANIWIESEVADLQNQNVLLVTLEKANILGKTVHCIGAVLAETPDILSKKTIWDLGLT